MDWLGLLVPVGYISILLGSLITFSSLYRKRKAKKAALLEPWFGPNTARDLYFSLLHLGSEDQPETLAPESLLKAALMRRATEDLRRLMKLRSSDAPLMSLTHNGHLGEELVQRHKIATQELEAELNDVVETANTYSPMWGKTIFMCANEMASNGNMQRAIETYQSLVEAEMEWWSKKSGQDADRDFGSGQQSPTSPSEQTKSRGSVNTDSGPPSAVGSSKPAIVSTSPGTTASVTPGTATPDSIVTGGDGKAKKKRKGKKAAPKDD